ncbi:MAG: biotin--[acetyl-CoA-carboxylase] ligase [Bacteroidetes bacterium]|nr:biotin--[acetyl-CoA-carboxylase] ligase [Bacteroidota bacterium]
MSDNHFFHLHFNEISSTNDLAKSLWSDAKIKANTIVSASYQNQGKGQQNKVWESEADKNLLFTMVVSPYFLKIEEQVYLNMAVSLAVYDYFLNKNVSDCFIKWPNDIIVNHKKVSGILIENSISQSQIKVSFIGIGININQTDFYNTHASSLALITGKSYDLFEELKQFETCFVARYKQLKTQKQAIFEDYHEALYLKNVRAKFSYDNQLAHGKITGVNKVGQLLIIFDGGETKTFSNKEVQLINENT